MQTPLYTQHRMLSWHYEMSDKSANTLRSSAGACPWHILTTRRQSANWDLMRGHHPGHCNVSREVPWYDHLETSQWKLCWGHTSLTTKGTWNWIRTSLLLDILWIAGMNLTLLRLVCSQAPIKWPPTLWAGGARSNHFSNNVALVREWLCRSADIYSPNIKS